MNIRISRIKSFYYFILMTGVTLLGLGMCIIRPESLGQEIFFKLSGAFIGVSGAMGTAICFKKVLKAPTVLVITEKELIYFYSVFHNKKKRILIPWNKIWDIRFSHFRHVRRGHKGPAFTRIDFINIFIEKEYLADYSAWRDNLFYSSTTGKLSIASSLLRGKELKKLRAYAEEMLADRKERIPQV